MARGGDEFRVHPDRRAGGCAVGSAAETWLKADLATVHNTCTLVYGHRPRWASNSFASADKARDRGDRRGARDQYLTGHATATSGSNRRSDGAAKATGLTQLTVGTGGAFYTGRGRSQQIV